MNELVFVTKKGNLATDSLMVAEMFGKQHKHVLESIRKHIENLNEINDEMGGSDFWLTSYKDIQGKERTKYIMTEEACMSLILTFTGKKALMVQRAYMKEFNRMKECIKKQQEPKQLSPMEQITNALALATSMVEEQRLQIATLETKIEEDEPLMKLVRNMIDSDDLMSVADLANYLTQGGYAIGEKNLFKWLRKEKYLKQDNTPAQRSYNLGGLFRKVPNKKLKNGYQPTPTSKVTCRGLEYFAKKLLKNINKEEK